MPTYPAARYAVVGGELKCEVITGSDQERPGWEPSPHKFRPLAVNELIHLGHSPAEAAVIHQRELRRVAMVFAGHSLAEAERLATTEPGHPARITDAVEDLAEILARIHRAIGEDSASDDVSLPDVIEKIVSELRAEVARQQTAMDEMVAKFDANWKTLTAENAGLKAKLAKLKGKAKEGQAPAEPPAQQ